MQKVRQSSGFRLPITKGQYVRGSEGHGLRVFKGFSLTRYPDDYELEHVRKQFPELADQFLGLRNRTARTASTPPAELADNPQSKNLSGEYWIDGKEWAGDAFLGGWENV